MDALLQPSIALAVVLVVVVVTNRWRVLGWGRCVPFQHHDMVRWGNVLMVLLAFMDNGSAMAAPAILGSKNPSHEGPCMMCTSQEHTPFATEWTGWHRVEHHGSSGSKDPSHEGPRMTRTSQEHAPLPVDVTVQKNEARNQTWLVFVTGL